MISHRHADIFKKVKEQQQNDVAFDTPLNGLKKVPPSIFSVVHVYEPTGPQDGWKHEFTGTVMEIDKHSDPIEYHIQDQEENVFIMPRDKFDYPAHD